MGNKQRRKGHDLEREWVAYLREIGYKHARTTRQESNLLDSCGVDIANIPFVMQCKAGYESRYPRYNEEWEYTKYKLLDNYPESSEFHTQPFILVHKLDYAGKTKFYRHYVSMDHLSFKDLLREHHEMFNLLNQTDVTYKSRFIS